MLCQRACFQGTILRDTSKNRMIAVIVEGTWQAVSETGMTFRRQRGKLRGHAMHRRPEKTAVGNVAQVERDRDSFSRQGRGGWHAAASSAMYGSTGSALCEQQAPNKTTLFVAIKALGDVHPRELQIESRADEALDRIIALLNRSSHDGGVGDVNSLFAASKSVRGHSTLHALALRSHALVAALTPLMDPCARNEGTYRNSVLAPQMAMLQTNL
jgi:hypothetical protein